MRIFAERQPLVALAALGLVVFNMTIPSLMLLALYEFDPVAFADPASLFDRGPAVADLLRLALLSDMVGYLALAPVVVYFHLRLREASNPVEMDRADGIGRSWLIGVLTFAGLAFVVFGASGAALMASVGPPLLHLSADAPGTAVAARVTFGALNDAVVVGLWALGLVVLGVWLVGIGWLIRAEGRAFAGLGIVAGLGALAYGVRAGLTGRTPFGGIGPLEVLILAAVGLLYVWMLWLVVRLWRGR